MEGASEADDAVVKFEEEAGGEAFDDESDVATIGVEDTGDDSGEERSDEIGEDEAVDKRATGGVMVGASVEEAGVEEAWPEAGLEAGTEAGVETSEDARVEEARLEAGVDRSEDEIDRVTGAFPVAGAVPVAAYDERLPVMVCDWLNE